MGSETLPNQSPLCRWGRTGREETLSAQGYPFGQSQAKKAGSRDFFPTHPISLPRGDGEAWGGRDEEFSFTLLNSIVPSPHWALTRKEGWGAPGAHEALLGAPCPVGPARGPETGPGWEAVLQPQLLLGGRSSSAARGHRRRLAEGRRLCAQGAVPTPGWGRAWRPQRSRDWGVELSTSGASTLASHPTWCVPRAWKKEGKKPPGGLSHHAKAVWPGRLEVLHF